MSRAEATRARILRAATEEFAAHGIAGARVDRIAASAQANKNLIYVYFSNKDALFDTVFTRHVTQGMNAVPFTPDDLPGYAGRLFDFFQAHPEVLRLAIWQRLERGDRADLETETAAAAHRDKLAALSAARYPHDTAPDFSPGILLNLVLAIASAWGPGAIASATAPGQDDGQARRAVVRAVSLLLARQDG